MSKIEASIASQAWERLGRYLVRAKNSLYMISREKEICLIIGPFQSRQVGESSIAKAAIISFHREYVVATITWIDSAPRG